MITDNQNEEFVTDGWKNFEEFIDFANKNCNWLILRNFEYLPNNFFGNDQDIDLLCDNIDFFVKTMKLKKRSWGISSYEVIIDNKIIPVDLRFLGDGYYEKLWQYKMLKNKIYTPEGVPRMNNIDYFYSLIYHCKIQKTEVKKVYIDRLYDLSKLLNITNYTKYSIADDRYIAKLLSNFMKKNFYIFVVPMDINVPKNNKFFRYLDKNIKKEKDYKTPIKIKILMYIPNFLFKLIPLKLKNILKRFFENEI